MTEVLKCRRQCSHCTLNVVQGCVTVVYLSRTILWHGLGKDPSHNQTLPLCLKIAPLLGSATIIVILKCESCGGKLAYCTQADIIQTITQPRLFSSLPKGEPSDCAIVVTACHVNDFSCVWYHILTDRIVTINLERRNRFPLLFSLNDRHSA